MILPFFGKIGWKDASPHNCDEKNVFLEVVQNLRARVRKH